MVRPFQAPPVPTAFQDPEPPEWQEIAMDQVNKPDMNMYGFTEGARPYHGGGNPPPVPKHIGRPPPVPRPWEMPQNQVQNPAVRDAASKWARDQISGKQFKAELKKHGYKVDLRQRDRSDIMEVEGPEGFKFLQVE